MIVTIIAFVIWVGLVSFITLTDLTWHDLDWTTRLPPVADN